MLCCRVIDACTTSNDMSVKSKCVLNVMLEPKFDLYAVAIFPSSDQYFFHFVIFVPVFRILHEVI